MINIIEECGSAWTEVVALAAAQEIAIHVGPSRIPSQALHPLYQLQILLEIRRHCLDCIVEFGSHHRQVDGSKYCWRQFSKAPAHHEEDSTSAREPFPALQRGLEGSVDSHSKIPCCFDHRDCGTISESRRSYVPLEIEDGEQI